MSVDKLTDVVDRATRIFRSHDHPIDNLAQLIIDLARVVGDVSQLVSPVEEQRLHMEAHQELESRLDALTSSESPREMLEIGREYEVVIRVRATVTERHDGHGPSYTLLLDQRDYVEPREIGVDADEIVTARPR